MHLVGTDIAFLTAHSVATTRPLAMGDFSGTVTSLTSTTITSVAPGTVNQAFDRYSLQCVNDPRANEFVLLHALRISIPGKLAL